MKPQTLSELLDAVEKSPDGKPHSLGGIHFVERSRDSPDRIPNRTWTFKDSTHPLPNGKKCTILDPSKYYVVEPDQSVIFYSRDSSGGMCRY